MGKGATLFDAEREKGQAYMKVCLTHMQATWGHRPPGIQHQK